MPTKRLNLLQGTLDLIVLRILYSMGPQHSYGIASRLEQISEDAVQLNQGSLYPALVRLEQRGWIKGTWKTTENSREARYYSLTAAGHRALGEETKRWRRIAGVVDALLAMEA
jgi:PadR family transcriptional regulator PadR